MPLPLFTSLLKRQSLFLAHNIFGVGVDVCVCTHVLLFQVWPWKLESPVYEIYGTQTEHIPFKFSSVLFTLSKRQNEILFHFDLLFPEYPAVLLNTRPSEFEIWEDIWQCHSVVDVGCELGTILFCCFGCSTYICGRF